MLLVYRILKAMPVGVKTLPTGVPHSDLVCGCVVSMPHMCMLLVSRMLKVMPVGVKTLPAGVPHFVRAVKECPCKISVRRWSSEC